MTERNTIEVCVVKEADVFIPKCNVYFRDKNKRSERPQQILKNVSWLEMPAFLNTFCEGNQADIKVYYYSPEK